DDWPLPLDLVHLLIKEPYGNPFGFRSFFFTLAKCPSGRSTFAGEPPSVDTLVLQRKHDKKVFLRKAPVQDKRFTKSINSPDKFLCCSASKKAIPLWMHSHRIEIDTAFPLGVNVDVAAVLAEPFPQK